MEAVPLHPSFHQSTSAYRHSGRIHKRNSHIFISRPSDNVDAHSSSHLFNIHRPPPFLSSVHFSVLNPQQQPPLLPLPVPNPKAYSSLPSRDRGRSCPPTNRRSTRTREKELTPNKSKSSITRPRKHDLKSTMTTTSSTESLVITSSHRLGPEPSDLPKEVSRVLKPVVSSSTSTTTVTTVIRDTEKFSGSIFYHSPPPSSLPLPKFYLTPKLSCNVEACGIDARATDNLRRLLRLR
ncbi:PREDICTED: uncharacterized protein LOC109115193 [Nelumbo nucifera]|uniref:Uncharacterized protein LOC109115193 n=2 Tax=Nelumbo nucifera TaxID=4432 RepID=A0A1U8Q6N9_NELNU|nr:PREDICTED: uncharacterized protein LOC109115193 [Nelumbo nucifera]DAD46773.1 TPA_asm: hypothetical protein HUJ06_016710 [Nelumbo nucifera]